ncbi:MAG: LruC domain-containing protein [Bacteroidales bacterium]|nr:LruC domain-containing protein [Bacteroidales bacterium]
MKKFGIFLTIFAFALFISNCKKDLNNNPEPEPPVDTTKKMSDLVIPQDFNFETSVTAQITINDFKSSRADGDIKYEVYLYNSNGVNIDVTTLGDDGDPLHQTGKLVDVLNNLNAVKITDNPNFTLDITIPGYYDTLFVTRNDLGHYTSMMIPITAQTLFVHFPLEEIPDHSGQLKDDPTDILYAVNSLSEMYSINPLTGEVEYLPNLPSNTGGSWTCAIDPVEEVLYTIGINSPYYLYAFDLNDQTWENRGKTQYQGPRLGYNINDGMLYYSFGYWMLLINPENGKLVSYYRIYGLDDLDGGDVCFANNGTMYISSESGLYRCTFDSRNSIYAERLSAENLPNYPNSLTFDQNQELWWASNVFNEGLNKWEGRSFIMDTVTGAFEDRWTFTNNYIHDLATMPLDENQINDLDSDGDGIIDFYDEYPNDGDRAYDTYTPSVYGWGTYAFEDLWPYEGDYDFNDLVLNYRYTHVFNSEDRIVETYLTFNIKNIGGSFRNGFGIELDMDESLIENVTGSVLSGLVTLNGKGLEAGQAKPVVILFDDAMQISKNTSGIRLVITYSDPIATADFGTKNPFIFINQHREKEVHLANMPPTSLADVNLFGTGDDDSNPATGRYYKTSSNLPWAIDIIHDFVFPQEKVAIIQGYNKFADWAESGGVNYKDWYKDQDGYRNTSYLVIDSQ